ncbi:endonuclease/exonuclease/phosphatase family protein [Streptomyces sp. NPDC021356]|uniref:endonuclease/exonuclease/phosphatase family protein n=1 Tax=Streptomyces sp. NPDC021356 TaxID=3154900 RepID=UPI00340989D1
MRRLAGVLTSVIALVTALVLAGAGIAAATDVSADAVWVEKSAGQKWALRAPNGKYVRVEMNDTGQYEWRLRAVSTEVKSWERFTIHTNHPGQNITSLRSEVTGFFTTPELGDAGDRQGMLRARGGNLGSWQQFETAFSPAGPDEKAGSHWVTFKTVADGYAQRYVDIDADGTLRATSDTPVKFLLEPVYSSRDPGQGAPPQVPQGPVAGTRLDVMTWNVCGNNNDRCGWSDDRAGAVELTDAIKARLKVNGEYPDAIFFQEFCEKHAKPVERMLESETGRSWDVRFAPIHNRVDGVDVQKQCAMGPAPDRLDRGAYGVAIAVPDENTFYQRYDFSSPSDKEQRSALCATIPSRTVVVCTGHLSAGPPYDDLTEDGSWRIKQGQELRKLADQWEDWGYRPVFGGDMNVVPPALGAGVPEGGPSSALVPVYDHYLECSQGDDPTKPRAGEFTANGSGGRPTRKLDYLFAPLNANFVDCQVSATSGKSDHWSLHGLVSLPAR